MGSKSQTAGVLVRQEGSLTPVGLQTLSFLSNMLQLQMLVPEGQRFDGAGSQ